MGERALALNNLTSVAIPDSLTHIETMAFAYNDLTSVTIPDSVTAIGEWAFVDNPLTTVTIPNSVTKLHPRAFDGTVQIQWGSPIVKPKPKPTSCFVVVNGVLTDYLCDRDHVTIPDTVTEIGDQGLF